jgi:hypothetical protein
MSDADDMVYSNNPNLLILKGQISVHFMDGNIIEGEFATQDTFNIFLIVDGEPVMIPRDQIRFIKAKDSHQIEEDSIQDTTVTEKPVVFIGYSDKDDKEKDRLLSHLAVLQRAGLVEVWSVDQIRAGTDWEAEIKKAIAQAQVAVLLITANFLTSDFIFDVIIEKLLVRHRLKELIIFVVIVRACAWSTIDWLAKMEVRPRDGKAIWSGSDSEIDEALATIAGEVARLGDPTHPIASYVPETVLKERRIDAAAPSSAEVGQPIDLLVQVRFPNSLLLGIEDWPTDQKPSSIKQKTEQVTLEFPVNKQTGELGPARLIIRVVTPDFEIEGSAEQLVEIPPYQYSKLISFLLTPEKVGGCRINVEVYSVDHVYLGTVPIETEVGAQRGIYENGDRLYSTTTATVANLFIVVDVETPEPSQIPSVEEEEDEGTLVLIPEADSVVESLQELTPAPVDIYELDETDDDMTVFLEDSTGPPGGLEADLDDSTLVFQEEKAELPASLTCTSGPHTGEVFKLRSGITTVGRASDNTIALSGDKEMSRHHAVISRESGKFIIQDQNSLNGTFVNNEQISGPRYLEDGDIILVGVSTLTYQED